MQIVGASSAAARPAPQKFASAFKIGLCALIVMLGSVSARANEEVVDEISRYLNSLTTVSGAFLQIAPGDSITEGQFALRRPGRMYFRYDPPSPIRVVADGFWVAVFDEENDPAIDRYPLSETPLYLLLKEDVDLGAEGAVTQVDETEDLYRLTVVDPSGDTEGQIILVFGKSPIRLREWTVVDAQGRTTKVVLRNAEFNVDVENSLFVIETEKEDRFGD